MSDYDIDDYGVDDFELAQDDTDSGLFDRHTAGREDGVSKARPAGYGSVYEAPQVLDAREMKNSDGSLPDDVADMTDEDVNEMLHQLPEDEVEALMVSSMGDYGNPWDAYVEHAIFWQPWYDQSQKEKNYERYWSCVGYERARSRRGMRELYHANIEWAREERQRRMRKWREQDPEGFRAVARENMKKYRARMSPEQHEEQKRKARERMRKIRQQRKKT